MNVPKWLVVLFSVIFVSFMIACWWMSLSIYGGKSYELGRLVERSQNPAKEYIDGGLPFVWYKGTYYQVRYVAPKTFKVLP